jgi:Putative Ig domain
MRITQMRGGWRPVATVALVVFLGACTFGNCSPTANNVQVTPSTQPTPSPSPSASPTTTPTSAPSPPPAAGAALAITSLPFHNGEVGVGYLAVFLGATGGTGSYQWSISGGSFPPGLSVSPDGTVTGKNTTSGQYSFTVEVKDSAGATSSAPAGLGVFSALLVKQPCANQCTVGAGCQKCGTFGSASGGLAPYKYTLVGGSVPGGMTLSGLSLKGAFPQTPLGAFYQAVKVTDQFGAHQTVFANWFVYDPATLNGGSDCSGSTSCTATGWSYSGGDPTVLPRVSIQGWSQYCLPTFCFNAPSGPPPVWSAVVKGGTIAISAALAPNTCSQYEAVLHLVLLDPGRCATTLPSNEVDIVVNLNNCG